MADSNTKQTVSAMLDNYAKLLEKISTTTRTSTSVSTPLYQPLAGTRKDLIEYSDHLKKAILIRNSWKRDTEQLIRVKSDNAERQKVLSHVKDTLKNCSSKFLCHDPFDPPELQKLRKLMDKAESVGANCYIEPTKISDFLDGPQNEVLLTICGRTFLADIKYVANNDGPLAVSFRHLIDDSTIEIQDESIEEDISNHLATGNIEAVKAALSYQLKLENLEVITTPSVDLKAYLRNFEVDVLKMRDIEAQASLNDVIPRLTEGIGLVRRTGAGLRVQFYVPSAITLKLKRKLIQVKTFGGKEDYIDDPSIFSLDLAVEYTNKNAPFLIESTSPAISKPSNSFPISYNFKDKITRDLPFQYTFSLSNPIAIEWKLACNLIQGSVDISKENHFALVGSKLESLLVPNLFTQSNNDSVLSQFQPDNQYTLRFIHLKEQMTPAVMVQHIPVQHPESLPKIVTLLRQQIVFNELFSSCFISRDEFEEILVADRSQKMLGKYGISIDVTVDEPPSCLNLSWYESSLSTIIILVINILPNGIIRATLNSTNDTSLPCTDEKMSKFLDVAHSVPLALLYLKKILHDTS